MGHGRVDCEARSWTARQMQARAHRQHEAARQGRARAQELALSTRERIARSQARLARTYALLAPPVDPPPAP